jgi:hypothetical protein
MAAALLLAQAHAPVLAQTPAAGAVTPAAANAAPAAPDISLTGQPRSWLVQGSAWRSTGYDGALWGMSVEQVKALIGAAHPAALATLKETADPLTRTLGLALVLPAQESAPAPVTLSYVFGASSRGLIAVHRVWQLDGDPSQEQRAALLQAGTALASGFAGYRWPPLSNTRGMVPAPGALILFSGRDEAGGGVEIRLDGVSYDVEVRGQPGQTEHRAAPPGPAALRQSFVASIDHPDIYRIPDGAF